LAELLLDAGATTDETVRALAALVAHVNPRRLVPGQTIATSFRAPPEGGRPALQAVSIPVSPTQFAAAEREADGRFAATLLPRPAVMRPTAETVAAALDETAADNRTLRITLDRMMSLFGLLTAVGAAPHEAKRVVEVLSTGRDVYRLAAGETVALRFADETDTTTRRVDAVSVPLDDRHFLMAMRDAAGEFAALWLPRPAQAKPVPDGTPTMPAAAAGETVGPSQADLVALAPIWTDPDAEAAPARPAAGALDPAERMVRVARGDTLTDLLVGAGVAVGEAQDAIGALRALFNPKDIAPGHIVSIRLAPAAADAPPRLDRFTLSIGGLHDFAVARHDAGFKAEAIQKPVTVELHRAAGRITSSLWEAGAEAGVPPAVLMELIKAFSWDLDFQRDVQHGDAFEIVFERRAAIDGSVRNGSRLLAGALTLGGKLRWLYRFEFADGRSEFFDRDGRSARKAFLRTPIDGARLSSAFGIRRHPILGYSKMHRGIDFAAPTGTPIYAAGNGVVEFVGFKSGYGRYIALRHNRDYATAYAHMSAFGRGVHVGATVRQGQVIGYVGASGMATGPHLHYEVLVKGEQVNPVSVAAAIENKLDGGELRTFLAARDALDRRVAALTPTMRIAQR
ncbi:MAG: M23 family metallopeptidase, partial [Alphaproteobacteria bacterium]|nr:M23 family metallopeptidase [Alphaproteobacteria bacterium]